MYMLNREDLIKKIKTYNRFFNPETKEHINTLIENLPKEDKNSILKIKKS